jgi:CxxC-x17-CxxC domain-containing protein
MGRFNRESNFGRKSSSRYSNSESRGFGRRDSGEFNERSGGRRTERAFGGRDSGRRPLEMHKATCDKCGQVCEVPFKPTSGKPIYCSDCFRKVNSSESRPESRRPQFSDRQTESSESNKPDKYKKELDQINEKLNKILKSMGLD